MKENIHPTYYTDATVTCACGNTWTTGSTQKEIRTDVCSKCHPFFTGQQRIVDTAGQVERFTKRFETAQRLRQEASERAEARAERQRERAVVEIVDEDDAIESIEDLVSPDSEA